MKRIKQIFKFKQFSKKQRKVLNWWCQDSPVREMRGIVADGAIRSGKTVSMALSYIMWSMASFDGQNFAMCGKTIGAFRRNVLGPLKLMMISRGYRFKDHRSDNLLEVSKNGKTNYFYIFGGRDERSQDLIQGITLAGVFFDEVALMPESFVNQATARCSVENSKLWFNCNPQGPYHWFKTDWIDKAKEKALIYLHFTMDDNLSLSEKIKAWYRSMYTGVFFRRFILGQWVSADGLIYQQFAEHTEDYLIDDSWLEERDKSGLIKNEIMYAIIGVDFGGTKSAHSFTLTGFTKGFKEVVVLDEYYCKKRLNPKQLQDNFIDFVKRAKRKYRIYEAYCDSAEQTLIAGLEMACMEAHVSIDIKNAIKGPINDRIAFYNSLIAQNRWKVMRHCSHIIEAFSQAIYDEKKKNQDVRLDDGLMNVDSLDSTEYSTESVQDDILYIAA